MASRYDEAEMMTENHKDILTRFNDKLSKNMRVDGVLPKLVAEGIITSHEHEDLLEEKPSQKASATIRLIRKGKDKGFYVLIEALRDSAQGQLAKLLEDAEARCVQTERILSPKFHGNQPPSKKRKDSKGKQPPKKKKTAPANNTPHVQGSVDPALATFVPSEPWHNPMEPFYVIKRQGNISVCKGCRGNFFRDGSVKFVVRHLETNLFMDKKTRERRDYHGHGYYHAALCCIKDRHPYFSAQKTIVSCDITEEERHYLEECGVIEAAGGSVSKRTSVEPSPGRSVSKRAKADHCAGGSGIQSESDYESDVEGFDVSDEPFAVNVKPCSEGFYLQYRKGAYKMHKETRGKALIINVYKVVGCKPRKGTDVDRDNLKQLLEQLYIDVTVYNDKDGLTAQGIEDKVREFALPENHQDSQCAVLAVLSHGTEGFVYGTDRKRVSVEKLRSFLTSKDCKTLVGKPKLSLFQACRGSLRDDGVDHPLDVADDLMADHGDEIVGFPTKTGYKAWRNEETGSWFISAVVDVFQKHAHHMHVLDMMTRVNGLVRRKVTKNTLEYENRDKLQMTEVHSTVDKSWYLFPGIQNDEF